MANQQHLAILRNGVDEWNTWRKKDPSVLPDLSEAKLVESNLVGFDFSGADLVRAEFVVANLREADLSGADLSRADLSGANLTGANLSKADLTRADLSLADLRGANLSKSDLTMTNLSKAILGGADFTGANLSATVFAGVDLSEVKGLESTVHWGSSQISIDTIYRSKGNIPERFLRNCGVPDNFIEYMRALVGRPSPLEFYSCFLSYSSKDQEFAERLHADLQSMGVRVWFAPSDIKIGDSFRERIEEAIRVYDKLLLVLSENSINSRWVRREVETASKKEQQEKRTVLFPVRLDNAVMVSNQAWAAAFRQRRHIGDFTEWKNQDLYQKAFSRLMRELALGVSIEKEEEVSP